MQQPKPYSVEWHAQNNKRPVWAERLYFWLDNQCPIRLAVIIEEPIRRCMCFVWGHVNDICVDATICSRGLDYDKKRCYRCNWHE